MQGETGIPGEANLDYFATHAALTSATPPPGPGYTNCVLTPNLNEFRRLASTLGVSLHGPNNDRSSKLVEVTAHLRGPTLVSKGPVDAICDGKVTMICNASGGGQRQASGRGTRTAAQGVTGGAWGFPAVFSPDRHCSSGFVIPVGQ